MKSWLKRSFIGIALFVLITMLFSAFFSVINARHECLENCCATCEEIVQLEESLSFNEINHASCKIKSCNECQEIETIKQEIQSKSSHECTNEHCLICYQIQLHERLGKTFCFLAVALSLIFVTIRGSIPIIIQKGVIIKPTLITLKVKLSN